MSFHSPLSLACCIHATRRPSNVGSTPPDADGMDEMRNSCTRMLSPDTCLSAEPGRFSHRSSRYTYSAGATETTGTPIPIFDTVGAVAGCPCIRAGHRLPRYGRVSSCNNPLSTISFSRRDVLASIIRITSAVLGCRIGDIHRRNHIHAVHIEILLIKGNTCLSAGGVVGRRRGEVTIQSHGETAARSEMDIQLCAAL